MSKKKRTSSKKKVSVSELNRRRRQVETHEKSAFFRTLDRLTTELGIDQPIRDRLGEFEKESLFCSRFRKPSVKSASKIKLPQKALKTIQAAVDNFLQNNFFKIPGGKREFSYYEYFTCFLTLKSSIKCNTEKNMSRYQGMREDYKVLFELVRSEDSPEIHFFQFLAAVGVCLSYPTKFDIQLTSNYRMVKGNLPYLACHIDISINPVQGKKVMFQDKLQTVFPLSIQTSERYDIQISTSVLYPRSPMSQEGLPLYFQRHAIDRLRERMDCMSEFQIFESLLDSFTKPEAIKITGSKFLISYYVDGIKLGYFVLLVNEGIAVVKTFLFLTNDGTPEGNLLNSKLQMSKYEKQHFSLDKLSAFYYSDIDQDQIIKSILKQSGCQKLIGIKSKLKILGEDRLNLMPMRLPTLESIRNHLQLDHVA